MAEYPDGLKSSSGLRVEQARGKAAVLADAGRAGVMRRGGRVAEGAALEMPYTGNCIAGSNPALSANQSCTKLGILRRSENGPTFRLDRVALERICGGNWSLCGSSSL